jgi:AraC-like DNA-binding protein
MDLRTCRLWEMHFEITGKLESLPYPFEVVREIETKSYYIDCSKRQDHPGAQLSYTLYGEGRFKINDKVIKLLPGMAFLQNHSDKRNAYFYPENGTEPWHFIWISFFSPTVEKMVKEINDNYGQIFHIPRESHLVKTLFSYQNSKRSTRFMSPFEGAHLVMDILTNLGKYVSEDDQHQAIPARLVKRVQEYMHKNIEKVLSIEDIAKECEVSREHLSRVFKEQLGESPATYLVKRRMELACRLLISTNLSCKEIASQAGYENVVSFNRTFKRLVKMTPGEIRSAGYAPQIR